MEMLSRAMLQLENCVRPHWFQEFSLIPLRINGADVIGDVKTIKDPKWSASTVMMSCNS